MKKNSLLKIFLCVLLANFLLNSHAMESTHEPSRTEQLWLETIQWVEENRQKIERIFYPLPLTHLETEFPLEIFPIINEMLLGYNSSTMRHINPILTVLLIKKSLPLIAKQHVFFWENLPRYANFTRECCISIPEIKVDFYSCGAQIKNTDLLSPNHPLNICFGNSSSYQFISQLSLLVYLHGNEGKKEASHLCVLLSNALKWNPNLTIHLACFDYMQTVRFNNLGNDFLPNAYQCLVPNEIVDSITKDFGKRIIIYPVKKKIGNFILFKI